jgi:excinuclease ABC subunit C
MAFPSQLPQLPHLPGVYIMRNNAGNIIYIGKARNLKKRVSNYFSGSPSKYHDRKTQALVAEVRHVDYVPTASEREALVLERRLISRYKPVFNVMWKDDKSYPFLALTLQEDFPRLFLTRKRKKDGTLYFGPYPSVSGVKQLLKWMWRKKMFPLRPCKLDFDTKNLPPYKKVKSCLYLHTGECPAPCVGKINSSQYKKIALKAKWFLEGKKTKMKQQWQKDMRVMSKKMEYEKAATIRDNIETLDHMGQALTVREMSESLLKGRIQGSRAVQDLMTTLNLKKPPERIECFDISHIQGTEKVASMVSFLNGRPDKSQYRHYIIRSVKGVDDFKSMAEVVGRRYRRLKSEKKSSPDLVLVDGGKGQLSAAWGALKKEKCGDIPLAALAKEEEEVFIGGKSSPIRLPMDAEALLLLRHIRDEAHRFAIRFHRKRRQSLPFVPRKMA